MLRKYLSKIYDNIFFGKISLFLSKIPRIGIPAIDVGVV